VTEQPVKHTRVAGKFAIATKSRSFVFVKFHRKDCASCEFYRSILLPLQPISDCSMASFASSANSTTPCSPLYRTSTVYFI